MGWKIPKIKIRVPEVCAPRAMAKPARPPKPPRRTRSGGRLRDFDLTVFSNGRGHKKGITHIDMIRELLISGGNRSKAAKKLGISPMAVSYHIKNIRRLPDAQLLEYAGQLNIAFEQIRIICADKAPKKGITHIDAIRELLASNGNRTNATKKLGVVRQSMSHYAKNIMQLSDAQLLEYAKQLGTTVTKIKEACADTNPQKGITHINVIRELLASGGSRTNTAKKLKTARGNINRYAKNIMQLSDAKLQEYAAQLGTTVALIKEVCAPILKRAKKKLFRK